MSHFETKRKDKSKMLKGYKYNQNFQKRKLSKYTQEHNLLHEFLSNRENNNLMLEYGSPTEAVNAKQALGNYAKKERQALSFYQKDCYVFVVRKGGDENEV